MKTKLTFLTALAFTFLVSFSNLRAQTLQTEILFTLDNTEYKCDGGSFFVTGDILEHFTIFYNPQTGYVERIHNNVLHSNIINAVTKEKLKVMDSGSDNLGWWWWQWGLEQNVPFEGTAIGRFKIIGKGVMYNYKFMLRVYLNPEGVPQLGFIKGWEECNP
jgi:hypothetical protein